MTYETRTPESLMAEYEAALANPDHKVKAGYTKGCWKRTALRKFDAMDRALRAHGIIHLEGAWLRLSADGTHYTPLTRDA